jgi:hypothetical protein
MGGEVLEEKGSERNLYWRKYNVCTEDEQIE